MKTIIATITTLILFCTSAISQTKSLDMDIRGRSCAGGSGLCSTAPTTGTNTSNMKNFNIQKLTSKSMVIEIETSKLTVEDQRMFFGKEYSNISADEQLFFIQEQDFIFDINTLLYLELDPAFRLLKRGTYPLEIISNKVKVTVVLSAY